MNIISHGMSSFYVVMVLSEVYGSVYEVSFPMLLTYFLISLIPDMGGLWIKELKDHHRNFLHTPIFWVLILIIGIILGYAKWAFLIFAIVVFHFITDFITERTSGIQLLYPFSNKEYIYKEIHPHKGGVNIKRIFKKNFWTYVKFYFSNKNLILFEFFIVIIGLISLYLITQ